MRTLRSLIIFLLVAGLLTWAVVAAVNRRSNTKNAVDSAADLLAVPSATATPTPSGYVATTAAPVTKVTATPTATAKATATPTAKATAKVATNTKGKLPKTGAADGAMLVGAVSLAGGAAFSAKNALARRNLKKAYRKQGQL